MWLSLPHLISQKAYNAREGIETQGWGMGCAEGLEGQKAYNAREGIETKPSRPLIDVIAII
mgnify:CR=1 FL=1